MLKVENVSQKIPSAQRATLPLWSKLEILIYLARTLFQALS